MVEEVDPYSSLYCSRIYMRSFLDYGNYGSFGNVCNTTSSNAIADATLKRPLTNTCKYLSRVPLAQYQSLLTPLMILRLQRHLAFIFVIVLNIIHAKSDPTFDCTLTIENIKFDLTSLSGEHVINRTRETPPTTMVDSLRFNLCADLETQGDLPEQEQVRFPVDVRFTCSSWPCYKLSVHLEQDSV
jgi:hypothetical protein